MTDKNALQMLDEIGEFELAIKNVIFDCKRQIERQFEKPMNERHEYTDEIAKADFARKILADFGLKVDSVFCGNAMLKTLEESVDD